ISVGEIVEQERRARKALLLYEKDRIEDEVWRAYGVLHYARALADGLKVVDASAFALCRDNGLTMRVFGMGEPGNITRALLGERIGTLVSCD
ncbi:MAG: hypothetical protein ACFNS9_07235, partial [Actinomyces sp.]